MSVKVSRTFKRAVETEVRRLIEQGQAGKDVKRAISDLNVAKQRLRVSPGDAAARIRSIHRDLLFHGVASKRHTRAYSLFVQIFDDINNSDNAAASRSIDKLIQELRTIEPLM